MSTIIKLKTVLMSVLILLAGNIYGSTNEPAEKKVKEVSQSYPVSGNDLLSVENSYGSIVISHWNKNEVSIRATIEANGRNESRAKELLERVNIEINKAGNKITAITSLKTFNTGNNESLKINYMISMPSAMQNHLVQKYGDIVMPDNNEGQSRLVIKYGNIKAGSFTKELSINAAYGNVTLGNLSIAKMELAYCGRTEFGNGKRVEINSKYSKIKAQDIKTLRVNCSYGDLKANEIQSAEMDFKYSNATIEYIPEELAVSSLSYSTLIVNRLSPDFKRLYTSGNYGKVDIRISSGTAFKVEMEDTRYGSFDISGFNVDTRKDGSSAYSTVNGGSERTIRIGGKYNNVKIRALN